MIRIHISTEDLVQIRFAFSPIWELVASYRVLLDTSRHTLHLPWASQARRALQGLDLSPLSLMIWPQGYIPDFLLPPPRTPLPEFAAELEQIKNTPPEIVRREMIWVHENHRVPHATIQPYLDNPSIALGQLTKALKSYWDRCLSAHWSGLHALLEGDILYRSHALAFYGPKSLFTDLHSKVRYIEGTIEVDNPNEQEVIPNGRGLLLIPLAFAWPDLYVTTDPPWQPTLAYSPRGVAGLWSSAPPATTKAFQMLLGPSRARLLKRLITPCATSDLARILGITPGAVSQQLAQLEKTGVVESSRKGHRVYYRLSPVGEALLRLFNEFNELQG